MTLLRKFINNMTHSDFVHLHVHTQYSLLDGACPIPNLIELASKYKMPAIAMTDHGVMFGAIEFYSEAMAKGIKPIIGCEVYIAPDSRFEKSSHGIQDAAYHLILLVKDEEGYGNLIQLVTKGYTEGFYYKPRIDKELLARYSKGLIGLTSCIKGEVPHLILIDQKEQALSMAGDYRDIFGKGDFYLELQNNRLPEQDKANAGLIELGKKLDIPFVATNDVHYLLKSSAQAHETLLCLQTQTTLNNPKHMKFATEEFYFKSPDEMKDLFSFLPEAISNTIEITEKCNLELEFNKTHLPHYDVPEGKKPDTYLRELCLERLPLRYKEVTDGIKMRLEHELKVIKDTGFVNYFLVVWDFIRYAKEKNIPVGPGRGSAAGSIASYILGITDIDPIKYGLLFERFLNPDRLSMPDIDIDFCFERRGEVINYVTEKYGKDNVAQIITFGTMGAKAVIRDVGRVMEMPYPEVDRIAKLIPNELNITIKSALEQEPELKALYQKNEQVTKLMDTSMALEGLTRHASTHAAGVVISKDSLTNHVPLLKTSDNQIITMYPMGSLEKIGLMKIDFLGLRTLTVIDETLKLLKRTRGLDLKIEDILLNDKKTFDLLSKADTSGVFQMESSGMRDLTRKIKPKEFNDIIALVALFRPGPMHMLEDYIRRKNGEIPVKYDHPLLKPILEDTYGIMLYQEQVIEIVSVIGGFSLSKADLFRRAMGKKIPEVMEQEKAAFIEGAIKNGISKKVAERIYSQVERFAGYGFNKSHSAAYAMIAYETAYLKANYPVEFMAALLTSEKGNTDKIVDYIDEANRIGIKVLPPCVNESFYKFTVVVDSIRFGLSAVKNVGEGAIESIIKFREDHGKFKSFYDFCEHVDLRSVNRKVIESLIKCGAFDSFKLHRSQLMAMLDKAIEVATTVQRDRDAGQMSFFDTFESQEGFKDSFQEVPNIKEWSEGQLLSSEKEMLGFYVTGHPLARYEKLLKECASASVSDLPHKADGDEVSLGGVISKVKHTNSTRTGEKMAIVNLEDMEGTVEVPVYPDVYKDASKHLKIDSIVFVQGRVTLRNEQPKVIASEIVPLDEARARYTNVIIIQLFTQGLDEALLNSLKSILALHPGKVPVYLKLVSNDKGEVTIQTSQDFYARASDNLALEIEKLLGEGVVKFSR